jgi:hypothetical protein
MSHLYTTQMLITMFTRARHWTLSWDRLMHFTSSHCIFKIHFIIVPSMFRSRKWSLPFRFPY